MDVFDWSIPCSLPWGCKVRRMINDSMAWMVAFNEAERWLVETGGAIVLPKAILFVVVAPSKWATLAKFWFLVDAGDVGTATAAG